jgi:glycopeptide antibiotics resistance protein
VELMLNKWFILITKAIALAIPLWLIFRIVRNAGKQRMRPGGATREILLLVFFAYIIALFALTLTPLDIAKRSIGTGRINLVPLVRIFKTYHDYKVHQNPYFAENWGPNLVGNVLLFIPFGLLMPLIFPAFRKLRKVLPAAAMLSILIELVQYLLSFWHITRFTDIDDVILNVIGAAIGFAMFLPFRRSGTFTAKHQENYITEKL